MQNCSAQGNFVTGKRSGKKAATDIINNTNIAPVTVGATHAGYLQEMSADSIANDDHLNSMDNTVTHADAISKRSRIVLTDSNTAGNRPLDLIDEHVEFPSVAVGISSSATLQQPLGAFDSCQSPVSNRDKFLSRASSAVIVPALPSSPGSNRDRFMANCQPLQVSCDLATVGMHNSSVRFSFQAVVLVVYPATKGPERRHVQLIDSRGSTGITIWNENVRLFDVDRVGEVVKFSKLCIVCNNGKKSLSMGRDSTVTFVNSIAAPCEESKWWQSLLMMQPLRIIDVHDCTDDVLINVAGIVGMMVTERKRVRDQDRDLLCIRLTDRTGYIDVRSWTHCELEFSRFLEKPLLMQRVRVTSFAGTKILELLAGPGTVLQDEFPGQTELQQYWLE
jgi:hypothetical protein